MSRHAIVIVGGGTAGITVAARLHRAAPELDIALIEPGEHHYYQPLFTLVAAGVVAPGITERREDDVVPEGVTRIHDRAVAFDPVAHTVTLGSGAVVAYEQLVVCPGIMLDWDAVEGLREGLSHPDVVSIYELHQAERTWAAVSNFVGGRAIFTKPSTPMKCGGAPQKIMYLAADRWRRDAIDDVEIVAAFAGKRIFGIELYEQALQKVLDRYDIAFRGGHDLIAVDADRHEAVFRTDDGPVTLGYDLLHVTPPQAAPDVVRTSPLANGDGWVEVDIHTLQHTRFPDVFSLGDSAALPTAKTGAAIRKQAPVLVANLLAHRAGAPVEAHYDGYSACPILTGYGKVMMAEFDYENHVLNSFPLPPGRERRSMYLLKRYGLPVMYWHGMLEGIM